MPNISTEEIKMEKWQKDMQKAIKKPEDLIRKFPQMDFNSLRNVISIFPVRITQYYFDLIKNQDDPIFKQSVPDEKELQDLTGIPDPLSEEEQSPVPCLVHRYPDRVLLMVTNLCAVYCRFCTRKRLVGRKAIRKEDVKKAIKYIEENPKIREVIISGGDPLTLSDDNLDEILKELRKIQSVEVIRIGTRMPCTLPSRVTPNLCKILKKYHPIYINTHFNHPDELTEEAGRALEMLSDSGIPLGNQSVLLKGVNDDHRVLQELFKKLLKYRTKPYYLYQADLVEGTHHFRTPLGKGIEIMQRIQGTLSGMCIPKFMLDSPGGGGKIPLTPKYLQKVLPDGILLKNYQGKTIFYPEISERDRMAYENIQLAFDFEEVRGDKKN